jgi:predicted DNA-binding protein YlxM (UPF0122 family)
MLTDKQTKTLILWAQNYTMSNIAKRLKVSISTIKTRLKQIKKSHLKEYENTESLRNAHKKLKTEIKYTKTFTELRLTNEGEPKTESGDPYDHN